MIVIVILYLILVVLTTSINLVSDILNIYKFTFIFKLLLLFNKILIETGHRSVYIFMAHI